MDRRYMTDDVMKQATATEDDDVYNETLQTNARLMVSPYTAATINYLPQHHHHHPHQLQQLQQVDVQCALAPGPAADKRWLHDVTTIISSSPDDDLSAAGYTVSCAGVVDRHHPPASLNDSVAVPASCRSSAPVCSTHMYESPRFQ